MEKCYVIVDNQGNIASSIRKIEKNVVAYISYHTVENGVYMMYATKERALRVLDGFCQAKDIYGFETEFHVEEVDRQELVTQSLAFTGENMVLVERECG